MRPVRRGGQASCVLPQAGPGGKQVQSLGQHPTELVLAPHLPPGTSQLSAMPVAGTLSPP